MRANKVAVLEFRQRGSHSYKSHSITDGPILSFRILFIGYPICHAVQDVDDFALAGEVLDYLKLDARPENPLFQEVPFFVAPSTPAIVRQLIREKNKGTWHQLAVKRGQKGLDP